MSSRMPDAVRRIFTETFRARDIAEPLASFDAEAPSAEVRRFMQARDFDVVGVRGGGQVVGYLRRDFVGEGACGQYGRALDEATAVSDDEPLLTVLVQLLRAPFLLVTLLGRVGGIITPADLQKTPVRMWLFGMVTLIEMRFAELIERHCPGDTWKEFLSEARLQKAEALLAERRRRNLEVDLVDCLQFSDKGKIVARHDEIRTQTVFSSRRQVEEATRRLEQLRNHLAHAQDIVASDWDTVGQLCDFVRQPSPVGRPESGNRQRAGAPGLVGAGADT